MRFYILVNVTSCWLLSPGKDVMDAEKLFPLIEQETNCLIPQFKEDMKHPKKYASDVDQSMDRYNHYLYDQCLASLVLSQEHLLLNWEVLGSNVGQYSRCPGHYNNEGCSSRLKTSFVLNPVTEGKTRNLFFTCPYDPSKSNPSQWDICTC